MCILDFSFCFIYIYKFCSKIQIARSSSLEHSTSCIWPRIEPVAQPSDRLYLSLCISQHIRKIFNKLRSKCREMKDEKIVLRQIFAWRWTLIAMRISIWNHYWSTTLILIPCIEVVHIFCFQLFYLDEVCKICITLRGKIKVRPRIMLRDK